MKLLTSALACLPFAAAQLGERLMPWQRQEMAEEAARLQTRQVVRDTDPSLLYPARTIQVPVDHFKNLSMYEPHSDATFPLRYWFDASNYQPGGPVIILQSGETSGVGRLPFLQKGIVAQLTQETGGIGVILEHRYYGTSVPVPDFSTENLRFLTTEQALADQAFFSQNIVFPGFEDKDLTSKTTAHITYGGSYAGAFVAFLRLQYPDVFWGAISSSGVPKAIYDYWEYYAPIAEFGPTDCIDNQETLIHIVDTILDSGATEQIDELKGIFGLSNVTQAADFANVVSTGVTGWQSRNWDPAVGSTSFDSYCRLITSKTLTYPGVAGLRERAAQVIENGGYAAEEDRVTTLLNLIGYINATQVASCARRGTSQDSCFSSYDPAGYEGDDLSQTWKLWPYQYCTEWGYLQTGSGVPADQRPLLSRRIDLPYSQLICNYAFNITSPPDVDRINKFGGYDISYPRLAWVDGEADPWRPAGVHAFNQGAKDRVSTTSEPFLLIPGAVHHWDENYVFPNQTNTTFPPAEIVAAVNEERRFVAEWMKEWQERCLTFGGCS